jgi:DNA-binding response OmpR family regulator
MTETRSLQRILIFDDDSDFRKLLLVRLGKMFPEVELEEYDPIARGVPELDFDWSRYDVLLLDYFLCIHGVTGLDILRKNRKNPLFPTTIMLTGAGNEEIAVRALKSGVSDYIRKETLNKEELRKSILNAY